MYVSVRLLSSGAAMVPFVVPTRRQYKPPLHQSVSPAPAPAPKGTVFAHLMLHSENIPSLTEIEIIV